jgi:hypothetical protein
MPRAPRVIHDQHLYEVVPRAREGLPLPPTETTNQLLSGILARTQRDQKVTLCNFVEMNNHAHQHVIPNNPEQHTRFYMEYQKKVTDTVRKLMKRKQLSLWERRPSVILLAELEDAIKRLIYMFLNPVRAGLVVTIDHYPGLTTWNAFKTCEASVSAQVVIKAKWTPVSALEPLPAANRLSAANDRAMAKRLGEAEETVEYDLVVEPLKWLQTYGITDPAEIEAIRQRIISAVYAEEAAIAKERREEGQGVIGAERLKHQEYMASHSPKAKERRIFVICGNDETRPRIISAFQEIFAKCRQCYEALKKGLPHQWPPGTFIPWLPPKECRPGFNAGFC